MSETMVSKQHMKKGYLLFVFLFVTFFVLAQNRKIQVSTNYGNMKFLLYDNTPLHRDAFIELAKSGYFDGTLFYRVIKDFMIQGGSKDSRNAPPGKFIGYGDPTKTVDDEIRAENFCKKGALCAPRQPNEVNVFKKSDISQFFVVQGRVYSSGMLDTMEMVVNKPIRRNIVQRVYSPEKKEQLDKLKAQNKMDEARVFADEIKDLIETEYSLAEGKLFFSEPKRLAYTTIGGVPELDNEYTVFGEIIEGFEVIDKIASLKTDENNRPFIDVKITVSIIN